MGGLTTIPLFSDVDEDTLARFESQCVQRTYSPGQMIIDQMETSRDVRFIISGTVRIVARMVEGREVIFNDFGPGQFFGELSAIDGGLRSANVTAHTKVVLFTMPPAVFEAFCAEVPSVGWGVMQHMVTLIRLLSDRLSEFSFLRARHRLYAELLRQSRERHAVDGEESAERIISPKPKQGDIADRISSRREIVSREMKDLERAGIITKTRGGLVISNPDELARMAAEGWLS